MIEEAAGTRMFETKKQAALKTIEKKQTRVDEITMKISEEITPTLERLRSEKRDYETWISNNVECERLGRLCIAITFDAAEKKLKCSENEYASFQENIKQLNESLSEKNLRAEECKAEISEVEKLRESQKEGPLQKLKNVELEYSKDLVKSKTNLDNLSENINEEKENLHVLQQQLESCLNSEKEKQKELDTCCKTLSKKEADLAASDKNLASMRESYQNACAGIASEGSVDLMSLPEQIGTWEKRVRDAESKIKHSHQHLGISKDLLKELTKKNRGGQQLYDAQVKERDDLTAEIAVAEKKLGNLSYNPAEESSLKNRSVQLRKEMAELQDKIDSLSASLDARLNFVFKDPEMDFDRSKVKGLVARLVRVNNSRAATALEITAGAKLYQVVVDSENTGKLLLQKGELKKRVTILPLNKISSRCTDATKVQRAKSAATSMGGSANLALELVGYEKEMQKAMEYVFGSTIICDTSDIAKAIAFDKQIRNRTVTLDGDSYDPVGTLTGGSKNSLGVLLVKIHDLTTAQEAYSDKEKMLSEITAKLTATQSNGAMQQSLIADIDIKKHALKLCEDKLSGGNFAETRKQIIDTEQKIRLLEEVMSLYDYMYCLVLILLYFLGYRILAEAER